MKIRTFANPQAYREHMHTLAQEPERVEKIVRDVLQDVRRNGDRAVKAYTQKFDGVALESLRVPQTEIEHAIAYLDPAIKDVWIQAAENIERFHRRQKEDSHLEFSEDGTLLGWKVTPIDRVGVYIPGGKAVYPSSLLMNVIPAQIAGVPRIALVSPPGQDGLPHKDILACAAILGLDEVYAVGGAQAIGAFAYGTETIPAVYKITGPGNQYVAEAKRQVSGEVGIDSVAGPSEILILCDQDVDPEWIVRDLLSQAEHDTEARAVLITTRQSQAKAVAERLAALIPTLPRKEIIEESFARGSGIIQVQSLAEGFDLVNEIAPEHLELITADPLESLTRVRNAGAIFLGVQTPEPVGDYFAGPNHTIPTGGRAKFSSPLSVQDFVKKSSILRYSAARLAKESAAIRMFAEREQLFAHAEAVRVRNPELRKAEALPAAPRTSAGRP
jgi:histidinol dehydrogenase